MDEHPNNEQTLNDERRTLIEVNKLTSIVNKINGLKLVKKNDKEFTIIDEALYCAARYWDDNKKEEYRYELEEFDICAIIIKKTSQDSNANKILYNKIEK